MQEKLNVTFFPGEIYDKFHRHMAEVEKAVSIFYHCLLTADVKVIDPLQTDSLAFSFLKPEERIHDEPAKTTANTWLFKKTFGDVIVGLQEALKSVYVLVQMMDIDVKTQAEPLKSKEAAEELVASIYKKAESIHFPDLIADIEMGLNISFAYKNYILSINQVRNCLEHRAGIVAEKDLTNKMDQCLELDYVDMVTFFHVDGKNVELTWEMKKTGIQPSKIFFVPLHKKLRFSKGELIKLDQNVFNAALFSAGRFILDIFESLPNRGGLP